MLLLQLSQLLKLKRKKPQRLKINRKYQMVREMTAVVLKRSIAQLLPPPRAAFTGKDHSRSKIMAQMPRMMTQLKRLM